LKRKSIILFGLAVAILLIVGLRFYNYVPDDTFITLRYARNLTRGEGLVFNRGERVEGYTNFLWLILISSAMRIGLPAIMTARILGLMATIAILALSGFAVRGRARELGYDKWKGALCLLLPPMLLAASAPVSVWALSGTEIPLFTAVLLLGLIFLRERRNPASIFAIFGLLGLIRPEGLLFYGLAGIALLARAERKGALLLQGAGILAALYIPYLIWKWSYFGSLLPNTFFAKTGPLRVMIGNGSRYLARFVASYGYLLPLGLLLARRRVREWSLMIPALFVLAHWLAVMLLGGDWMPHYRLLLPTLPIVVIILVEGLFAARSVEPAGERPRDRSDPVPIVTVMLIVLVIFPGGLGHDRFETERLTVRAFAHLGQRLREILPPTTSLGLGSTGAIGYYTDMRIVDILGLTDEHIARRGQIVATQPGHMKTDGAHVMSLQPDLLLLGNVQIHRGRRGIEMMRHKVQEEEIVKQPGFKEEYDFLNIPLGNGFFLSCYKRRDYFLPLDTEGR
jgi:arabinofuranosyltransferase